MLTNKERQLLTIVDKAELERHLDAITAADRLAGGAGEAQAAEYIVSELEKAGLDAQLKHSQAIISNPLSGRLSYKAAGGLRHVPAKTRSFSANTGGHPVTGRLTYLPGGSLPTGILDLQISDQSAPKDLAGAIVLSEASSPAAVLASARRGATGFVQWWNGGEELIHEGIVNPVWGMPQAGEAALYPSIPVVAVSGPIGKELRQATEMGATVNLSTDLEEKLASIPLVEAVITPPHDSGKYLLIGNHLDSWYEGATDNGTGNALALLLAQVLHGRRNELHYGVKIAWWSGHSNGRYAGSAAYARDNFADLAANCLAYMNIDMPGIRGATDYTKITAGPELFDLARQSVADITDVVGSYCPPVRGWDQSFQNIGVTPYFIWASALPTGHPDTTNNSFMPWWWHTEKDGRDYHDPLVFLKDTRLYLLAAWRILTCDRPLFATSALVEHAGKVLAAKSETSRDVFDLSGVMAAYGDMAMAYRRRQAEKPLTLDETLFLIRKINQLLHVEKSPHLQDWAVEQGVLPGLDAIRLLRRADLTERQKAVLRHHLACQVNRIIDLCASLRLLLNS